MALLVYNNRTLLKTLASQEGVQQGHVLGSLGYNMSIHPDYVAVQAEYKDQGVRLVAIHDDLTVVGPAEAAFAAFDMFASRLLARGDLRLRPDKCRVLIASTDASVVRDITALANTRGVAVAQGAMKLHGGCVGTDTAKMRDSIRESVSRFDKVLEAVSDPKMPSQIAWHIIRQCVVSGVGFFARITQPHIGRDTFVKRLQTHTRCRQDSVVTKTASCYWLHSVSHQVSKSRLSHTCRVCCRVCHSYRPCLTNTVLTSHLQARIVKLHLAPRLWTYHPAFRCHSTKRYDNSELQMPTLYNCNASLPPS